MPFVHLIEIQSASYCNKHGALFAEPSIPQKPSTKKQEETTEVFHFKFGANKNMVKDMGRHK
jgi:hypothetical protein